MRSSAFTVKGAGILRVLTTEVNVLVASDSKGVIIKAIWDTGATGSAITKKVSQELGLIPTGFAEVHTANGLTRQNTFTIDIKLPNGVTIQGIIATEVDALSGGCDALIGMDVITLGDFAITNHRGVTCMSFRVPSSHQIDYVKNPSYGITPIKNILPGNIGSNNTPKKKKRK